MNAVHWRTQHIGAQCRRLCAAARRNRSLYLLFHLQQPFRRTLCQLLALGNHRWPVQVYYTRGQLYAAELPCGRQRACDYRCQCQAISDGCWGYGELCWGCYCGECMIRQLPISVATRLIMDHDSGVPVSLRTSTLFINEVHAIRHSR